MALIPWWINYPNVNDEILNLDWLLSVANENTEKISNFINLNTIKYANPILWDITSQYEANTIVVDPQIGDAYISTQAVPYGVALSNDSYWTKIYNYADAIKVFHEQIAAADEQLSTTATAPRAIGDLVWLNGLLYRVTAEMIAGDSYVVGSNCVKTTIEEELKREMLARAEADTALGERITGEATARAEADTALGERITGEATARADADTALGLRITELESRPTNRNFKKVIIVGDSWAVGYYGGAGHPGEGWGDYMAPYLGITENHVLTVAEGGSGFINGTGVHFDQQILNAYNNYPSFRDADLIVCVGGFNDAQDNRTYAEVKQGCALFLANVKNYFPNAECHIFPLQLPYKNAMTIERWTVLSAIKNAFYNMTDGNIFFHYGIHRWANEFGAGSDAGDNAHLNHYGYKYLGQKISECIKAQSDYYPTLIGTVDTTAWSSKIAATNHNSITEDNGVITINLVLSTSAAIDSSDGAITMPDFAVGVNDKYFFINNTALALWRNNGIQIANGSISAGLIAIQMSFNAGD